MNPKVVQTNKPGRTFKDNVVQLRANSICGWIQIRTGKALLTAIRTSGEIMYFTTDQKSDMILNLRGKVNYRERGDRHRFKWGSNIVNHVLWINLPTLFTREVKI